jgi:hypothetical protein
MEGVTVHDERIARPASEFDDSQLYVPYARAVARVADRAEWGPYVYFLAYRDAEREGGANRDLEREDKNHARAAIKSFAAAYGS